MENGKTNNLSGKAVGLAGALVLTVYAILFLWAESEMAVMALLVVGVAGAVLGKRFGMLGPMGQSFYDNELFFSALAVFGVVLITAIFHEDHYVLFLVLTVILYMVVCLGLNIQLGYAGILNFSGASFFGVGCYTAAVLNNYAGLPDLLIIVAGGGVAAAVGSLLVLPVLRTSGHYAALVTIAFALLFKTFLEVNDTLGGPQGLPVEGMSMLGHVFNDNVEFGAVEFSFYANYLVVAMVLLIAMFAMTKRLERSWVGLNMDAIRLDEVASACFGLNIVRWKIVAFMLGNLVIGLSGALYGMVLGYIAPTNFSFGDSLILLSIVLLSGIGNPWGLVVGTLIVVVLPEKLQIIQEYRFLLYSTVVILMLLFRPEGLIPRKLRAYVPGWRP